MMQLLLTVLTWLGWYLLYAGASIFLLWEPE